jgi:UDP-2-acetamido-3-amino-2,3-dideoxy-glucuronate N-acetyltransferase
MGETFFQHDRALVESEQIGPRTRIWAFVHVLPGAVIGEDCNICDHVFIENDVIIGNRVTVKCGVQLWDGVRLDDDVFVGPNVTFTNDPFPRSRQWVSPAITHVAEGASIGANATILPGVMIGKGSMVGAGSVITSDVPPHAIVAGNPSRIVGYSDTHSYRLHDAAPQRIPADDAISPSRIKGASVYRLPVIRDARGALGFAEIARPLPFLPKRYFVIFDVPSTEIRGQHAHRTLHQFLVCLQGSCEVVLDDGTIREEIALSTPTLGLHIPPMVWSTQYKYSSDAILLVLASDVYDADDYIREYDVYLATVRERTQSEGGPSGSDDKIDL